MPPAEVFLSHASQDRGMADRLAGLVRGHGVPVWYSPENILGAQQWHDQIGAALARCDWFMLLLSPAAVESKWVKRELLFALREDRYADKIVPLLHEPCDYDALSWTLSDFQMVPLNADFAAGCRALLQIWGIGLQRDLLDP